MGFNLVHRVQDNEGTCAAVYGHGTRISLQTWVAEYIILSIKYISLRYVQENADRPY